MPRLGEYRGKVVSAVSRFALALVCFLAIANPCYSTLKGKKVCDAMDRADQEATGIDKLTSDEQEALGDWIVRLVKANLAKSQKPTPGVLTKEELKDVKRDSPEWIFLNTVKNLGPQMIIECGLPKLSINEIRSLGTVFMVFTNAAEKKGSEETLAAAMAVAGSATPTGDAIESTIDGTFNGWSSDVIIKLDNGQIWQQASYHYEYHYAYRPKVIIYASGGGYKAKVEGTSESVGVRQLK